MYNEVLEIIYMKNAIIKSIKNKYTITVCLMALTVLISVSTSAYYSAIQKTIHNAIRWSYEQNNTLGEVLANVNGYVLNGRHFNQPRSAKFVIYSAYSQVVVVNAMPRDVENPASSKLGSRGTGWFYSVSDTHGIIVTNHHVVESTITNSDLVKLTVNTGMDMWDYDAELIGIDEVADIAVLRVTKKDNEDWEALTIADYDDVMVGDHVAVMGHGLGLPFTATQGEITYINRYGARPLSLMLQIDAVINQGNSGGPVINMNGELVGVAQSILSPGRPSPGWDGVGFAVNAKQTKRSIEYILSPSYLSTGYVPYAEYPFATGTSTLEEVKNVDKEDRHFAKIDYTDTPTNRAETLGKLAGFEQDDLFTDINGTPIRTSFDIIKLLMYAFPGDTWSVTVLRDGKDVQIDIVLREQDRVSLLNAATRRR